MSKEQRAAIIKITVSQILVSQGHLNKLPAEREIADAKKMHFLLVERFLRDKEGNARLELYSKETNA